MPYQTMKRMLGMQSAKRDADTEPTTPPVISAEPVSVPLERLADHHNFGMRDAALSGWYQDNELFKGFDLQRQHNVIDLGCGDGGFAGFCASHAGAITVVDIDDDAVARTEQKLRNDPRTVASVTALASDSNPLPLPDKQFDRLLCSEVMEHVDDPEIVLRELHRVGKDDALYMITVPAEAIELMQKDGIASDLYFQKPNHVRIFEGDDFQNLAHKNGFDIVSSHPWGFYQSIWWLMFWITGTHLDDEYQPDMMRHWGNTWQALLDHPRGMEVAEKLNLLLPKSIVYLLRKS